MINKENPLLQLTIRNNHFIIPVIAFFVCSSILYLYFGNSFIHLQINNNINGYYADVFFSGITELGNGIVVFILLPIVIFFDINLAIRLISAFILSTLVVWLCKFVLFPDALRPIAFIKDAHDHLRLIPWVKIHRQGTFPSGHSTTIFTIFCCFAFAAKSKGTKTVLFLIALVIAFSRVYLSQHFLQDVAAGALNGTMCTLVVFAWQSKYSFYWKSGRKKYSHHLAVEIKKPH